MKRPRFLRRRSVSLVLSTSLLMIAGGIQANAVNFDVPAGETETVDTPITGNEELVKQGEGTLVLTASNAYTQATAVYNGVVQVTGSGAGLFNPGAYAWMTSGTLTVDNQATLQMQTIWIESADGQGDGVLNIDNATATITEFLSVGDVGVGRMNVTGSSSVTTDRFYVGTEADSEGHLTVRGSNASFSTTNYGYVADFGNGWLTIDEGASVQIASFLTVGYNGGASGTVQVTGSGSLLEVDDFTVGWAGQGTLSVTDGAQVNVTNGGLYAGLFEDSFGSVTISGSDTVVNVEEEVAVGYHGSGEFTLSDGATLNADQFNIAYNLTATGTATITGSNTTLNATTVSAGNLGYGTLRVLDGAQINADDFTIGTHGTGIVEVDGEGTRVTTATLDIGLFFDSGESSLTISNGALVHVQDLASIGEEIKGTVSISNATLRIDGGLLLGNAVLEIVNGGTLETSCEVNGLENTESKITISGPDSLWHHRSDLLVLSGETEMLLSDGGRLRIDGDSASGRGDLWVDGSLYLRIGGTDEAAAPGYLDAASISTDSGDAVVRIVFNHTANNYTFDVELSGNILIRHDAGITTFTNEMNLGAGGLVLLGGSVTLDRAFLLGYALGVGNGILSVNNSEVIVDGVAVGDYAQVTFSGPDTLLSATGLSAVGTPFDLDSIDPNAIGLLQIEKGAAAIFGSDLIVGGGMIGSVTVTGENSALLVESGLMILGYYDDNVYGRFETGDLLIGKGILTISNGAVVDLKSGTLELSGSGSLLNIGSAFGDKAAAPGYLVADLVTSGTNGYGAINFNHTATASDPYVFSANTEGDILLVHNAGATVLDGTLNHTAGTLIFGGAVELIGSMSSDTQVLGGSFLVTGVAEGNVNVNSGVLIVNGTVGGSVQLNGGVMGGSGYIAQNLLNNGLLRPGNSPGTLTIGGNYTQTANGSLLIEFASSSRYDRLVVGGTASLNGSLLFALNGSPGSKAHTFITAGEVEGKFAQVFSNTLLTPHLIYQDDAVQVRFEREESLRKFARDHELPQNVRNLARALDRANAKGQLDNLLEVLYSTELDELPKVLASLSPEALTQIFQLGFNAAQVQYNNIERRLDDVRNGAVGFSANGLSLTNPRGSLNYDGTPIVNTRDGLQLAGFDGKSLVGKQHVAPVVTESRWGFFATGSGEWADVETTPQARGSEFSTGGVTVGADYRVCNHFVIGIAGGYTNISSDLFNGGKVEVNSGRGSVYATAFGNGFYGNALVGGAYNSYKTKRNTLGGTAFGNPDGGEFNALLGGGYDFHCGGWTIGPVASLQYTYLGLSSYTEHGSLAPMHYPSQSQNSLRSQLGGRVAYAWNVNNSVVIRPEVRLQWQHEYLDSTAALESGFVGGGGVFTVNGPELGRDSLILDAGVTVQFSNRASVYANYTAEIGRKNYSSNAVSGGFRLSF